MDQKKIGSFLKELRKEKELTQEQLSGDPWSNEPEYIPMGERSEYARFRSGD